MKFVKFDRDTVIKEPQAKQPRTEMFSPTFAGAFLQGLRQGLELQVKQAAVEMWEG